MGNFNRDITIPDYDGAMGYVSPTEVNPLFFENILPANENSPAIRGRIYIAGPMRGYPAFNFPAFYRAEAKLRGQGWLVGNPARMDDEDPIDYARGSQGIRQAMDRDLKWINSADAIFMLKGWEKSAGAQTEWRLAVTLGLEIYYEATI